MQTARTGPFVPQFCTVLEAAALLRCNKSRVYVHLKEGSLRAVKRGGSTLIEADEIARFVAALKPAIFKPLPDVQSARNPQ